VSILGKHVLPRPMASDLRAVHRRASVVGLAIVAALAGIGFKAARVALDQHEAYAEQANRQQLRSYKLPASRGEVVDRDFMTLAINDRVHKVVLNPRFIRAQGRDEDVVAALLTLFPAEDPVYLRDELAKDKAYRQLRMTLSDAQADALAKQGLPGVSLEPASERVYPRGLLAAHVLGRISGQGGTAGVELGMDEALRGRDALSPAYFAAGKKLLVDGVPDPGVARGDTVMLTIDSAIQAMVEEEINTLVATGTPPAPASSSSIPATARSSRSPTAPPSTPTTRSPAPIRPPTSRSRPPTSPAPRSRPSPSPPPSSRASSASTRPSTARRAAGSTPRATSSTTPTPPSGSPSPRSSPPPPTSAPPRSPTASASRPSTASSRSFTSASAPRSSSPAPPRACSPRPRSGPTSRPPTSPSARA
jgi:hypothetical protein